jgi:hypothetical protein
VIDKLLRLVLLGAVGAAPALAFATTSPAALQRTAVSADEAVCVSEEDPIDPTASMIPSISTRTTTAWRTRKTATTMATG